MTENGKGTAESNPLRSTSVVLPDQKEFFKMPKRFGHVPMPDKPFGFDENLRFERDYPRIELPFQTVDVVKTGAEVLGESTDLLPDGRNRLFFGDCLHVARMLPSESIDLIYIDPPFFSNRDYNVIFGDQNEIRSFSDIWEGGMQSYLIWLNARLYEMKRLLKPTGSLIVHVDWHASHYVKVELDKIFGYECFRAEIVWRYRRWPTKTKNLQRMHDIMFYYVRNADDRHTFNVLYEPIAASTQKTFGTKKQNADFSSGHRKPGQLDEDTPGAPLSDVWDIGIIAPSAKERIGYPTQKPEALLERVIQVASNKGDVVADFFSGGGTTCAVAQRLGRRWVGCDISRVAVSLAADRIAHILAPRMGGKVSKKSSQQYGAPRLFEEKLENPFQGSLEEARKKTLQESPHQETGFSVEDWGVYEIQQLAKLTPEAFREFVLQCVGARRSHDLDANIHGQKGNEVFWIGGPKETDVITANDVKTFALAVMKTRKIEERHAVMIGWSIDPRARSYAEQVMALGEKKPVQYIKLRLWPLAGAEIKAHVTQRHDSYQDYFSFVLPPNIPRIGVTRVSSLKFRFDVSEAHSMNPGGTIVNVQWDFAFGGVFSATPGYQLCRTEGRLGVNARFEGNAVAEYTFESATPGSVVDVACRVQDDLGGDGIKTIRLMVT